MSASYDHLYRLLLIGDASVGKTSLLLRYEQGVFSETFICTIGVDFRIKTVELEGKIVKVQVWDTAGQERFRTITSAYYRGAHGVLLCFDLTCRSSFERCAAWLEEIRKHARDDISLILVGNKCDNSARREVLFEEAESFATSHGMLFYETSAKDDVNVQEAFLALVSALIAKGRPVVFTLLSATSTKSSLRCSVAKLSGEVLEIDLVRPRPTVEEVAIEIGKACGRCPSTVRLVTADGALLDISDKLPGDRHHAEGGLRCSLQ
uniref:Rab1D n=1 Tax=Karlodinium veneficum TaxID=407301 RepID=B4XPB9_KARVE|nr:Rab1D [Karlodinium veneficum]